MPKGPEDESGGNCSRFLRDVWCGYCVVRRNGSGSGDSYLKEYFMAKKPAAPKAPPAIIEQIPSVQGGLSGIGSAQAPIIFLDEAPNAGFYNGIAHITVEALRFMSVNGVAMNDRVITAHLRMNFTGLMALKNAIAIAEGQARAAAKVTQH
jgi:hypothetical protein